MSKETLKSLLSNLFSLNLNTVCIIKNFSSIKKNKIKNKKILIFLGKKKLLNFINFFFFLILKKIKFQKNFFLLYRTKNLILGNNIYPNWPSIYCKQNFHQNFIQWLKKFFYIFFFYKKLYAIIIIVN